MGILDWLRGNGVDDLVHAAADGKLAKVEKALNDGAQIDGRCWHGHTALVAATSHRHFAVVDLLLRRGADPGRASVCMPAPFRDTDLGAAIARTPEAAEALGPLAAVIQIDRPLHQAAVNGDVDVVDLLIDAGAHVNDLVSGRVTALMLASMCGHEDVVRRLLDRDANIHLTADERGPLPPDAFPGSTFGFTALAFAAMHERTAIVHELARRGAPVDPSLALGATPLHIACANGHVLMADLLIELGAWVDVPMAGFGGSTPLMLASSAGHASIVKLLLAAGARRDLEVA